MYIDKIDSLLKKMTENFKNTNLDKKVKIQLLFLCRILLVRLSEETLTESLRKLWPNLLTELINIFEGPRDDDDGIQLVIEAFKLVELLSLLNLEDFQISQWIFFLDHFNVTFTPNDPEFAPSEINNFKSFQPMIAQFIDSDGVFEVIQKEDVVVSNGELVKNKPKVQIAQGDSYF